MEEAHYLNLYRYEQGHWWYRVRRKLALFLVKKYSTVRHPRVLDVGCGTGLLLKELSAAYDAHGIDFSPTAVEFCAKRGLTEVSLGSATSIPFPDAFFDVVLALDVIEHIEDDVAAVHDMKRVLKPGGCAIIFVPAFHFLWGATDITSMHFRRYRLRNLRELFVGQNFVMLRQSYFNTVLFLPILLIRTIRRLLPNQQKPEIQTGGTAINAILFWMFYTESLFLRYINFPFGVSAMLIVRNPATAR